MPFINYACPCCGRKFQVNAAGRARAGCPDCGRQMGWYYIENKQRKGPVPVEEILARARQGALRGSDMILQEGTTNWVAANVIGVQAAAAAAPAVAAARPAEKRWFYAKEHRKIGPLSAAQLRQQIAAGQLGPADPVLEDGGRQWVMASTVPELAAAWKAPQPAAAKGVGRPATRPAPAASSSKLRLGWIIGGIAAAGTLTMVVVLVLLVVVVAALNRGGPQVADGANKNPAGVKKNGEPAAKDGANKDQAGAKKNGEPAAKDEKKVPAAKRTLKELFAQLSPSVPVVEIAGLGGGGSGFLVRHGGKHLVVTNRHVIEFARDGVEVHFIRAAKPGAEEKLVVPKSRARIVAVHRDVDLALIDVSDAADDLARWKLEPVPLAAKDHVPAVGEHVFAIGHPGGDGGVGVLTRTLSDGIVSAVRRTDKFFKGTFTQVTVPINPGNSGGPIFDDEGKVVAVATFIVRKKGDLALEGLNFGLDVVYVHEILNDASKSLSATEIVAMLKKGMPAPGGAEKAAVVAKLKHLASLGYQPFTGDIRTSIVPFRLGGRSSFPFTLRDVRPGELVHIFIVSEGSEDVDLHVFDMTGRLVIQDIRVNPDPEVNFRAVRGGMYHLRISNLSENGCEGAMLLLSKDF